jgi:hypothetical protein
LLYNLETIELVLLAIFQKILLVVEYPQKKIDRKQMLELELDSIYKDLTIVVDKLVHLFYLLSILV